MKKTEGSSEKVCFWDEKSCIIFSKKIVAFVPLIKLEKIKKLKKRRKIYAINISFVLNELLLSHLHKQNK